MRVHLIKRIVPKRNDRQPGFVDGPRKGNSRSVPSGRGDTVGRVLRCWETFCGAKRNEGAKDITSRAGEATCPDCKRALVDAALAGDLNVFWI